MNRSMIVLLVFSMMFSTMMVITSHHWFSIWIGLEMNTLSVLPILCNQFNPRKVESTMKYFLIQAFSAAMILKVILIQVWMYSTWSMNKVFNYYSSFLFTLAMSLKLGLYPCHYWFPDVLQGMGFLEGLLLSTWQKIPPLVILITMSKSMSYMLMSMMSMISVLVGGWGGLNQTQIRKVLAFSSISHMGWICVVICYSSLMSVMMMMIYMMMKSSMFLMSYKFNIFSLAKLSRLVYYNYLVSSLLILKVLSLGGLPPLLGFLKKFLALQCLMSNKVFFMSGGLIMGSLLSLFFYLRMSFKSSLMLFPQHSLSLFVWRKVKALKIKVSFKTIVLSILSSLSILGLLMVSFLISFML